MATTSDFLFQGTTPSDYGGQVTDTSTMPAWYQDALRQNITRASQILGENYQPYSGQRIAGLTDDQTNANQMVRDNATAGNPYASQAAGMLSSGGSGFNQDTFNQYLNPYTQGANDAISQQGMQNFTRNTAPTIQNSFISNGMFGGSRDADTYEKALNDQQQNILNAQATNLSSNYNNAMSAYQTGQNQQLAGGTGLGQLGQNVFQNNLAGASSLSAIGGQQQALNQSGLDLAYQNFTDQKNYPLTQLQQMNSIIHGYQPTADQTQTTNPTSLTTTSPLNGVLSALGQASAQGNTNYG